MCFHTAYTVSRISLASSASLYNRPSSRFVLWTSLLPILTVLATSRGQTVASRNQEIDRQSSDFFYLI